MVLGRGVAEAVPTRRGVLALSGRPAARYDHRLMGKIRVALAEDNVLLREGVSRLVSANEEFELVGTASDLPQLLALVREQLPDVVITDIRMPPTGTNEGIQAAAWLHENHPEVGVVVLSQYTAPGYAMALLEHGSAGRAYLLKERVASLAEMAQGKSNAAIASSLSVSERAVEKHTNSIFAKLGLSEEKDLNRRVKAVLLYLAEGKGG